MTCALILAVTLAKGQLWDPGWKATPQHGLLMPLQDNQWKDPQRDKLGEQGDAVWCLIIQCQSWVPYTDRCRHQRLTFPQRERMNTGFSQPQSWFLLHRTARKLRVVFLRLSCAFQDVCAPGWGRAVGEETLLCVHCAWQSRTWRCDQNEATVVSIAASWSLLLVSRDS